VALTGPVVVLVYANSNNVRGEFGNYIRYVMTAQVYASENNLTDGSRAAQHNITGNISNMVDKRMNTYPFDPVRYLNPSSMHASPASASRLNPSSMHASPASASRARRQNAEKNVFHCEKNVFHFTALKFAGSKTLKL